MKKAIKKTILFFGNDILYFIINKNNRCDNNNWVLKNSWKTKNIFKFDTIFSEKDFTILKSILQNKI